MQILLICHLIGVKCFLRYDDIIGLAVENFFQNDLCVVLDNGFVESLTFTFIGKCVRYPLDIHIWPDTLQNMFIVFVEIRVIFLCQKFSRLIRRGFTTHCPSDSKPACFSLHISQLYHQTLRTTLLSLQELVQPSEQSIQPIHLRTTSGCGTDD